MTKARKKKKKVRMECGIVFVEEVELARTKLMILSFAKRPMTLLKIEINTTSKSTDTMVI